MSKNSSEQILPIAFLLILVACVAMLIPLPVEFPGNVTSGEPLFAVIPTIGIGGPLAILALLFPSVFGGVLVLFRQWTAFLIVFSLHTLLLFFHWWFARTLMYVWWGTLPVLWLTMTVVTVVGVLLAWIRQRGDYAAVVAPSRTEHVVLWLISLAGLGAVIWYFILSPPGLSIWWMLTLTMCIGIWTGTLYKLAQAIRNRLSAPRPPMLSTEGVMLWAMVIPAVILLSRMAAPQGVTGEVTATSEGLPAARFVKVADVKIPWVNNFGGMIVSSPIVDGQHLYVAAAHRSGSATMGVVYCVQRQTGAIKWTFDNDGQMKQVFSSPRLANGKIFIGEGFHFDLDCKLYCLDADTGRKYWHFQTTSQTEASPNVVDGKVYFGAGNDGVYAIDEDTGRTVYWNYRPGGKLFRVGAGPTVVGDRVYVGSGVDRTQPDVCETALVCLKANTKNENGEEYWKVTTNLPNWAEPVVAGNQVFFGLGNGDLLTDDLKPAGAMLCLDAQTGAQEWRYDVGNGVHGAPAVDARHVYFGCRDGFAYCVGRFDGKLRWKRNLGSPILAATRIDQGAGTGRAINVYAIACAGRVCGLDAGTGEIHWSNDVLKDYGPTLVSSPALVTHATPRGIRRRLYFGAALYQLSLPQVYRYEDILPLTRPGTARVEEPANQ